MKVKIDLLSYLRQSIQSFSMVKQRHLREVLQSRDLKMGYGGIHPQLPQPARVREVHGADPACIRDMRIGELRGHVDFGSRESNH